MRQSIVQTPHSYRLPLQLYHVCERREEGREVGEGGGQIEMEGKRRRKGGEKEVHIRVLISGTQNTASVRLTLIQVS